MADVLPLMRVLALALFLTITIELVGAVALFGLRGRRELLVVALCQVVTNPLVELLCIAIGWHASLPLLSTAWALLLAAEVAAFVIEGRLYQITEASRHPWLMSGVLNAASFLLGLILL